MGVCGYGVGVRAYRSFIECFFDYLVLRFNYGSFVIIWVDRGYGCFVDYRGYLDVSGFYVGGEVFFKIGYFLVSESL